MPFPPRSGLPEFTPRYASTGRRGAGFLGCSWPNAKGAADNVTSALAAKTSSKLILISLAHQVSRISFDADVLSDLVLGIEIGDSFDDPRFRIRPRIFNRELDFQMA